MRVLVTRPEPAASATAEALTALGHQPLVLPLSRAVHDRDAVLHAFETRFDALIVTSAEACRAMGDVPDAIKARKVFCVGPATARAAQQRGFTDIVTAEGTGLSLAAHVITKAGKAALLYLAGEPRSPDLESSLARASVPIAVTVCYRMAPVLPDTGQIDAVITPPPQAILFYSQESARLFFRLPEMASRLPAFANTRFLCISTRTAGAIPPELSANVMVAATPDEPALLSLLSLPSSQN